MKSGVPGSLMGRRQIQLVQVSQRLVSLRQISQALPGWIPLFHAGEKLMDRYSA